MKYDFFISFAIKDRLIADPIAKQLRDKGFSVWISSDDLYTGDILKSEISTAIRNAAFHVILNSKNYMMGNYTLIEAEEIAKLKDKKRHSVIIFLIDCEFNANRKPLIWFAEYFADRYKGTEKTVDRCISKYNKKKREGARTWPFVAVFLVLIFIGGLIAFQYVFPLSRGLEATHNLTSDTTVELSNVSPSISQVNKPKSNSSNPSRGSELAKVAAAKKEIKLHFRFQGKPIIRDSVKIQGIPCLTDESGYCIIKLNSKMINTGKYTFSYDSRGAHSSTLQTIIDGRTIDLR